MGVDGGERLFLHLTDPPPNSLDERAGCVDHHPNELWREGRCVIGNDSVEHRFRAADGLGTVLGLRRALKNGEQITSVLRALVFGLLLDPCEACGEEVGVANTVSRNVMLADEVRLQRSDAVGAAVEFCLGHEG